MPTRPTLFAALLVALVLAAGPVFAADLAPDAVAPPPGDDRAPLDVSGRLRATGDGFLLEVGGTRLELRVTGDAEPFAEPAPGIHELRARFSFDGRTTGLLLRLVPPRRSAAPP